MSFWPLSSARTPSRTSRLSSARKTLMVVTASYSATAPLSHKDCPLDRVAAGQAQVVPAPLRRCRVVPCHARARRGQDDRMRHEASAVALTWIPSEAINGLLRKTFDVGITHYDEPPPEQLDPVVETVEKLRQEDRF